MARISVSPEVALADEAVRIKAWGLPPQHLITIRAWLKDERDKLFYSRAFYRSNDEGEVDLQHSPATGGDFFGVHPMGLFWALRPATPYLRLIKRDVMGSPFEIHLELYCHIEYEVMPERSPEATACLKRWYVSPGVQRLEIMEGQIRGTLFLPPGEGPFRGVIDLFGGYGGLIEFRSGLLASRGFVALSLAYFGHKDLPKTFDHLDLEYFEEAARFLINHPKVSGSSVGVIGVSKGAEVALAMASYLPQVAAAVCINGTVAITGSVLSYGGRVLPAIPYQPEKLLITPTEGNIYTHFTGDLRSPEKQACLIPVEKAQGAVLFVVGEDDKCNDSLHFAEASLARAKKYGKKDVYLLRYPGAGHLIEPPCSPLCFASLSPGSATHVIWGGKLVPHCRAQEESWPILLDFLRKNILCSRKNKL